MNDENTQLILRAIDQLNHQFSEFGEWMARLEQKVDIIGDRLSLVENRPSSLEFKVDSIDGRLSKVEEKMEAMDQKLDDEGEIYCLKMGISPSHNTSTVHCVSDFSP